MKHFEHTKRPTEILILAEPKAHLTPIQEYNPQ